MTYVKQSMGKVYTCIWRSAALCCEKTDNLQMVGHYLEELRGGAAKLWVFDAGVRSGKKGLLEEPDIYPEC